MGAALIEARLGGELQAPPGEAVEALDLAHHRGKAPAAQPLLHRPQHFGIAFGAHQQEAAGIEPLAGQRRRIEVALARDPEDLSSARKASFEPRQEGEAEACGRAVVPLRPLALDFVQRPQRQPAARQRVVQRGKAQRRDGTGPANTAALLDAPDLIAQSGQAGGRP